MWKNPLPINEREFEEYLRYAEQLSHVDFFAALLRLRIPSELAATRARMIVEDIEEIGFPVQPFADRLSRGGWYLERKQPIPLLYSVPDLRWGINKPEQKALVGSGTTANDLVHLSKCCEIARSLLGSQWPAKFRDDLIHPERHLDTLNEIWWLGLFADPHDIQYEPARSMTGKRPDWELCCGTGSNSIHLTVEIKRRSADIRNLAGQEAQIAIFDKVVEKFPPVPSGVPNNTRLRVACITLYTKLDRNLRERCTWWLNENKERVDAVVFFSPGADDGPPLIVLPLRLEAFFHSFILNPLSAEDLETEGIVGFAMHGVTPSELNSNDRCSKL